MTDALTVRSLGDMPRAVLIARRRAGLTQTELARRAHVSQRWLSLFENGKTPGAELHRVLGVLAALNVEVALHLPDDRGADAP